MANLVVTRVGNAVTIEFNDYFNVYGFIGISKSSYNATNYVDKVHRMSDHILVWGSDEKVWKVIHPQGDMNKGYMVDLVNGVTPTSLDHLFELINTLFQ